MKLKFDTHGNDKQKQACRYWTDNETFDIAYGGSKGSGKSHLGCSLIFGDGFIYPETHYFIARKKLNDLRKYTLPSIYEVFNLWGITDSYYRFDGKDNFFELYNGSKVFLLEAAYLPSDPDFYRFGSMQITRGWIEEAGEINVKAQTNLAASIGRWKNDTYKLPGKILQTCNPSKNYLYRDYYKKFKDGSIESWKKFIQALPSDNKMLPAGYIDNLDRILTKNDKERLLKGNWEYDGDPNTLCGYESICNIFTNAFVQPGKKYITADIARLGKDTTTIRVWDGWRVIRRVQKSKLKITESADLIKSLANEFAIPMSQVIVDEGGLGAGVVDILSCIGFVANAKPLETREYDANGKQIIDNYDMLKSQCGFKLATKINANEVFEPCAPEIQDLLTEELEQLKQKSVDSDMKKGLMSKDDIKELIGRSPDDLDTYIMRAYFDIQKPSRAPILTAHR